MKHIYENRDRIIHSTLTNYAHYAPDNNFYSERKSIVFVIDEANNPNYTYTNVSRRLCYYHYKLRLRYETNPSNDMKNWNYRS